MQDNYQEYWNYLNLKSQFGDSFAQYYVAILIMPRIPLSYWGLKECVRWHHLKIKESLSDKKWREMKNVNENVYRDGCFVALADKYGLGVEIEGESIIERDNYKENVNKMIELLKLGIIKSFSLSESVLGHMYLEGVFVKLSYDEAVKYLEKSQNKGDIPSTFSVAKMISKGWFYQIDIDKSIKLYEIAKNAGYRYAVNNLGVLAKRGTNEERNLEKAVEYYELASEMGYPGAINNIGVLYDNGEFYEKNPLKAYEYYEKAAEMGDMNAVTNIGKCYRYGKIGKEVDFEKAKFYFEWALREQHAGGYFNIAYMLNNGLGFEKSEENKRLSYKYYKRGAKQGDTFSMYNLAVMLRDINITKSVYWFCQAAALGDLDSAYNLGFCYYQGEGVEKNINESIKWFLRCDSKSNSCLNIGNFILRGISDMPRDNHTAREWLIKAIELGNERAVQILNFYDLPLSQYPKEKNDVQMEDEDY